MNTEQTTVNPFADPRPIAECDRCGSDDFADLRIHEHTSTMRSCRRCGRFYGLSEVARSAHR